MKSLKSFLIGLGMSVLFCGSVTAITIKMGTLVPPGSPWELNLGKLAAEWSRLSDGTVDLKIYAGGRAGDEPDMLRKLRFGQLQAAGITVSGLSQIYGGVLAPAIPMLVEDEEELNYVLNKMKPIFSAEFEKMGYTILFWTTAGWAHWFSKEPIIYPSDLKKQKMWIMSGNPEEENTWKRLGYHVVNFATMDMLVQLQSGGVEAFATNPLVAASNQWFGVANNMAGFRWAPFFGAFIISTRTWRSIPEDIRMALQKAANECGDLMREDTRRAGNDAIDVMQKYGLIINETPLDAKREWKEFVTSALPFFIGGKFDIEHYERAMIHLDEYRRLNGK